MKKRALQTSAALVAKPRKNTHFGYNVLDDTTRRRSTQSKTSSEVLILTGPKRQRASATARDDRRNFTLLAWMIRKHISSVSRFMPRFYIPSKSPEAQTVTDKVKLLMGWHGRRTHFDVLGRHNRDESMWLFEACKVIGGDAAYMKGQFGRSQGIEGDRICIPSGQGGTFKTKLGAEEVKVSEEGLVFNADGSRRAFCICRRGGERGDTLEFERLIPAAEMIYDGYWPERFDSNRGVSPLMTSLNEGADVRETREWLVLKAKASALFGLAFVRKSSDEMFGSVGEQPTTAPATEAEAYSTQLSNSIKSKGLINLDLDPGDDIKEIESHTPNHEIITFTREMIRDILLSLDIPFTMYDSMASSFSARIADRNEYEEACEPKREKNVSVLDDMYGQWLFPLWAKTDLFGFGRALAAAKMSVEEAAAYLGWAPRGRPWMDRTEEMKGHILALAAGVTSIPRICSSYGEEAYDIAGEQKRYIETCGIPLLYAQGGQVSVQQIMNEEKPADQDKPPVPAKKENDHGDE